MYYFDKATSTIKKTWRADSYEFKLKALIEQKMRAKNIEQITQKVILDILFEIELDENKDGSVSKRGRLDLDNLMKATIDSISHTIVHDDKLVFGVHAKIRYKKKRDNSFLFPDNSVRFSVIDYNSDTRKFFEEEIHRNNDIHSFSTTELSLDEPIVIPSYNSMYVIENNKRVASQNTIQYKERLASDYYKKHWDSDVSHRYFAIRGEFGVYNVEERDVDNMLKATFDSFSWIVYKDDRQILEFYVDKVKVNMIAWRVKLGFYEIPISNERSYIEE